MSEHGFERIDTVLAQLSAEMDASFEKQMCRKDHRPKDYHGTRPSNPEGDVDGPT